MGSNRKTKKGQLSYFPTSGTDTCDNIIGVR